jgi:hypothetical protein
VLIEKATFANPEGKALQDRTSRTIVAAVFEAIVRFRDSSPGGTTRAPCPDHRRRDPVVVALGGRS